MALSLDRSLEAITAHSQGFADVARRGLGGGDTPHIEPPHIEPPHIEPPHIEHCPDWDLADLVWHLSEVHWFWGTIAGELLTAPPGKDRRPNRPAAEDLVTTMESGAHALVETLRTADQSAPCWTWFPPQQDVAFITRHQVQEAAVHHWDAAHAIGEVVAIEQDVAVDCVEEFLTTSLADAEDVARLGTSLDGDLVLNASDAGRSWIVSQETPEAALTWVEGDAPPTVAGTASDVVLWLYDRIPLAEADPALVARFRNL